MSRVDSEEKNPCIKEQNQTFHCLNKYNYDREKCGSYFDNYNNCKKFWLTVCSDRKRKGIFPELPRPEERSKIKEEYKAKHRNP